MTQSYSCDVWVYHKRIESVFQYVITHTYILTFVWLLGSVQFTFSLSDLLLYRQANNNSTSTLDHAKSYH